jgi:hypothetical protein
MIEVRGKGRLRKREKPRWTQHRASQQQTAWQNAAGVVLLGSADYWRLPPRQMPDHSQCRQGTEK